MVLVRIAYAADLPTPDEVVRSLGDGGGDVPARPSGNGGGMPTSAPQGYARSGARTSAAVSPRPADDPVASEQAAPTLAISTFDAVVALAAEKRDISMKLALERDVRLVRCDEGQLEIALEPSAAKTLVHDLQRKLGEWTGRRWIVVVSKEEGAPSLRAQAEADKAELERGVQADPLVQAVLNRFPGAKIVGVTQAVPEEPTADAGPEESED
jgi:DNA polymerase-3 subunit gamma/tau